MSGPMAQLSCEVSAPQPVGAKRMTLKWGVKMFEIPTTIDLGSLVGERHAVAI